MSLQASVYVATSLDGYIARTTGELDWLDAASATVPKGEDCGYQKLMDSVDALVMGRRTYEQVLTFGKWPYGSKPVVVMSSREISFPVELPDTVTQSSETPEQLWERFSNAGAKRLYIDGGNTVQRFLESGLITDLTITVIPILLGSGISLFGELTNDVALKLIETKSYEFGFAQLVYEVV